MKFWIRWGLGLVAICVGTGVLYASGLVGNSQKLGLLLIAVGVATLYSCWRVDRIRQRVYEANDDDHQR